MDSSLVGLSQDGLRCLKESQEEPLDVWAVSYDCTFRLTRLGLRNRVFFFHGFSSAAS